MERERGMRRFSLYRRGRIWYVRLYNPKIKKYLSGRSTGETSRNAAALVASEWLRNGLPDPERNGPRAIADVLKVDTILNALRSTPLTPGDTERIVSVLKARELIETAVVKAGPGAEGLVAFLTRFWSHDQSPYVKEKLAHGHRIGRRHCYDMALAVANYWAPFFVDKWLSEIRRADLKDFSLWLLEKKSLKEKSINYVLSAGTVPLRWRTRWIIHKYRTLASLIRGCLKRSADPSWNPDMQPSTGPFKLLRAIHGRP